MDRNELAALFADLRNELVAYAARLLLRQAPAEDAVQTAFLRAIDAGDRFPSASDGARAWLFRVVSNIAIDELRRQSRWRESAMLDLREAAQADPAFLARSKAMVGSPETQLVARDHLIACFACTLGNLGPQRAAALLLKEVHGFSVDEVAETLEATPIQVKNWLQASRAEMDKRYSATCALIAKNGVCHQCVELDEFHGAGRGDPLNGTSRSFEARLEILRAARRAPWGRWHRMMFDLLDRLG